VAQCDVGTIYGGNADSREAGLLIYVDYLLGVQAARVKPYKAKTLNGYVSSVQSVLYLGVGPHFLGGQTWVAERGLATAYRLRAVKNSCDPSERTVPVGGDLVEQLRGIIRHRDGCTTRRRAGSAAHTFETMVAVYSAWAVRAQILASMTRTRFCKNSALTPRNFRPKDHYGHSITWREAVAAGGAERVDVVYNLTKTVGRADERPEVTMGRVRGVPRAYGLDALPIFSEYMAWRETLPGGEDMPIFVRVEGARITAISLDD